jgi:hypothetical protein
MMPGTLDVKGTKILAKSLFKELRGNGYSTNQILSLSTELIDLVTQDLRCEHEATDAPPAQPPLEVMVESARGAWRAAL